MNTNEFNQKIKTASRPIIVDLWAPWCKPCRAMEPGFKQAAQKYQGKVEVIKINADESQDVLRQLGVMGIPTVIAYANGGEIVRRTGFQSAYALEVLFDAALNKRKPAILPPAPVDRLVRTILGLAFLIAAFFLSSPWTWFSVAAGLVVIFTAYYDRCPIYKMIAPKIQSFFDRSKQSKA
jgi:thioredoxin 1